MKIVSHYAKKVGRENYGSECFSASVELDVGDAAESVDLADRLAAMWAQLRDAVDAEIRKASPANGNGKSNGGNGHAPAPVGKGRPANGNGGDHHQQSPRNGGSAGNYVASPKQISFLMGLASRHGIKPSELTNRVRALLENPSATVRDLTKQQASTLIEELKGGAA